MGFNIKNVEFKPVENWREGWKWISSWALALVVYLTTFPVPDEVLNLLPEEMRLKVVGVIAFVGLVMRFIAQSPLNPTKKK